MSCSAVQLHECRSCNCAWLYPMSALCCPYAVHVPQSTDYTGTVTIINNAATPAELDGVYVNLIDTMGSGDATDEALPDCPVDTSDTLRPITASNPFTIPANGRLSCKFTLKSVHSGALVGTATPADGGDGIVSKQWAVTSLMADSSCSRLVSGMAASELGGADGVLFGENGTTEEDVCSASSKVVKVNIPADADTSKACSFPVSTWQGVGGRVESLREERAS